MNSREELLLNILFYDAVKSLKLTKDQHKSILLYGDIAGARYKKVTEELLNEIEANKSNINPLSIVKTEDVGTTEPEEFRKLIL